MFDHLKFLWVMTSTRATDSGLEHLSKLKRLTWVSLRRTKVTPAGIEKLRHAFPKCQIDR